MEKAEETKRARVARGSRNPKHGKWKHYIVQKPGRLNKETSNKNAINTTHESDKRRLPRRSKKYGDACGPWRA
jgi:hypothetical protein